MFVMCPGLCKLHLCPQFLEPVQCCAPGELFLVVCVLYYQCVYSTPLVWVYSCMGECIAKKMSSMIGCCLGSARGIHCIQSIECIAVGEARVNRAVGGVVHVLLYAADAAWQALTCCEHEHGCAVHLQVNLYKLG